MKDIYYSGTLDDIPRPFKNYKQKEVHSKPKEQKETKTENTQSTMQANDALLLLLIFMLLKESI